MPTENTQPTRPDLDAIVVVESDRPDFTTTDLRELEAQLNQGGGKFTQCRARKLTVLVLNLLIKMIK